MLFNSVQYAAFLYLMVLAYWAVPHRFRIYILLAGSYLFYATFSVRFLGILVGESLLAFAVGWSLQRTEERRRRLLLAAGVAALVVVLAAFKLASGSGGTGGLGGLIDGGSAGSFERAALPVGISFFTFQCISYMVDVYRRELEPRPVLEVLTFIAFFPYLLVGPLSRGRRIFPQLEDASLRINTVQWAEGAELILLGLFQKVVVADSVRPATTAVLARFLDDPSSVGSLDLWVAAIGSVLWIVMDFAGYSNIARGSAKFFAIELPYNFRQPLTRSKSFQDFWRRYHLSLMAWFRDYIYRPLHRRRATVRNELVTVFVFMVSGLWHGLTVRWVLWGMSVGAAVVIEERLRRRFRDLRKQGSGTRVRALAEGIGVLVVFLVVAMWVITATLGVGFDAVGQLLFVSGIGAVDRNQLTLVALGLVALVVTDRRQVEMEQREGHLDPITVARAAGAGAIVVALIVFSGTPPQQFLYFNF